MQQRIWDEYELTYAGAKEYLHEPFDLSAGDKRVGEIRREIRAMGPVNVTAVEDYRACRERYDDLSGQRNDLLKAQDDLMGIIETLQRQMERQFMENFRLMQQYFGETFSKLFGGGHAELRLLDEKRRQIKPGDTIEFTNTATGEQLHATVVTLHCFPDFATLYAALPLLQCGYTPENVADADPSDMTQYYSADEQKQYGVVGIELTLIN